MPPTGNYTIRGATIGDFVMLCAQLQSRLMLWSCMCDKYGDWLVSTTDDTPLEEVQRILRTTGITADIIAYGELTTTLEGVPEFEDVVRRADEQNENAASPSRD